MKATKIAATCIAFGMLLSQVPPSPAEAASAQKLNVKLPSFPVELNGKTIDNLRAKYPILIYNDITYFPMTWDYAKALGLGVEWNQAAGLSVRTEGSRRPLAEDLSGTNSSNKTYSAERVSGTVKVNDNTIDNTREPYPLFKFRDITYFPMTWRFTHDSFNWETEWISETGYHIRGRQYPVLFNIVHDDSDFLYIRTGTEGLFKFGKKLDGSFSKLSADEETAILDKARTAERPLAMPNPLKLGQTVTRTADSLMWGGKELLSLKTYKERMDKYLTGNPTDRDSGINYTEESYAVDDQTKLLVVTVYYLTHIPAPYTPHAYHTFVIRDGKAVPVTGFNQMPDKRVQATDGSFWLASTAPAREDVTARNSEKRGQLAHIGKDNAVNILNTQLDAEDVDLLSADPDGSVLVRAVNDRLNRDGTKETDGFYRIDAGLKAVKTAESLNGVPYVTQNGGLYVLNPDRNTITDLTRQIEHRWWDYEIRRDL